MGEKLELKSIKEILGNTFFIPSYQRGYRWGKSQVEKLLQDINTFSKNKTKDEFYPLQPEYWILGSGDENKLLPT